MYNFREKVYKTKGWVLFIVSIIAGLTLAGVIISAASKKDERLLKFIAAYFISFALYFVLQNWYMNGRKKIIKAFTLEDFERYVDNLNQGYNDASMELLVYGLWNAIGKNGLYGVEEYYEKSIPATFFDVVTYERNGRIYRNPKLLKNKDTMMEIIKEFCSIIQLDKAGKDITNELRSVGNKYENEKKTAREEQLTMESTASFIESFAVTFNDNKRTELFKKIVLVPAIVMAILHMLFIDERVINEGATYTFEVITIILLMIELSKDKDLDYLH